MIVEDGLPSPLANINTLIATNDLLKSYGYFVMDDVPDYALPVWDLIIHCGVDNFMAKVLRFRSTNCVVFSKSKFNF